MRGSGVVQGLKSFASRLHPQLPLAPRESQKLLVALTSSFQNELDQVYPREADDGNAQRESAWSGNASDADPSRRPSSVTLADRHLASILTNPLLASNRNDGNPRLDLETARVSLSQVSRQDAMALLEEYQREGAASIAIAVLCLNAHDQKLRKLPEEERPAFLKKYQAGKRALLWLWRSEAYKDPLLYDGSNVLPRQILTMLILEGEEEFLWNCLRSNRPPLGPLPATLASQGPAIPNRNDQILGKKLPRTSPYVWESRVISAIVGTRLYEARFESADTALDAIFRACELSLELESSSSDRGRKLRDCIAPGARRLKLAMESKPHLLRGTDPLRFDKFQESTSLFWLPETVAGRLNRVQLHAIHPRSPTPVPALQLLRYAFQPGRESDNVREYIEKPHTLKAESLVHKWLLHLAKQLRSIQRKDDADWVDKLRESVIPTPPVEHRHVQLERSKYPAREQTRHYEADSYEGELSPLSIAT